MKSVFKRGRAVCVGALATTIVLVGAAGCGSSSDDSGGSSSTTGGSGSSAAFTLSEPLKITFLWQIQGESPDAISDFQNGVELAIAKINDSGGVGGKPIETTRVAYDPVDPQAAATQFVKAADGDPDIIIGFPGPSVDGVVPRMTRAGIPALSIFEDETTDFGSSSGSPWLFTLSQKGDSVGTSGTKYLVEELNKKKVGLIGTKESYGLSNIASSTAELKDQGLKPVATRTVAPDATDLTAQVLAMKDADALGDWSFPNVLGVQMNESLQNNLSVPTITGSGGQIAASYKLVDAEALPDLYAVSYCDPGATNSPQPMKDFVTEYKAKYGSVPSNYAPVSYDAVFFAAAAVESVKSTDADKVKSAFEKIDYTKGVCAPSYHSDAKHVLIHQNVVSHFAANGSSEIVKKYQVPPAK